MTEDGERDRNGRTPGEFVAHYLTERRQWEIAADAEVKKAGDDPDAELAALDRMAASYMRFMKPFVLASVFPRLAPNLGSPPSVDPATTTIERAAARGPRDRGDDGAGPSSP